MNTTGKCPQCGAEAQDEEWPPGICPACVLKLGLSGAVSTPPMPDVDPAPGVRAPRTRWLRPAWGWSKVAAATALAMLAALLAWSTLRPSHTVPATVVQFAIPLAGAELRDLAVSPDGRALAYTADDGQGKTMLWLRRFALPNAQVLSGTEGAAMPFWSPDSRHIGFFADGKLKKTGIEDGPLITLADALEARGGSWSQDGMILFAIINGGLMRVPGSGGIPALVITAGGQSKLHTYSWPQFLPDGRHFLVYAEGSAPADAGIYVGALDSGETKRLVDQSGPGLFADGYVLFSRSGVLLAQPFDLTRMEITDEPVRIRESASSNARRSPAFSAVQGVLAFRTGRDDNPARLAWLDRAGKFTEGSGDLVQQGDFALSPDGTSLAVVRRSQEKRGDDLWLLNLRRNTLSRLTYDGLGASSPVWSADGNRITFYTTTGSELGIRQVDINGSGQTEILLKAPEPATPEGWSPDGRVLLYTTLERGKRAVWMIPADGDRKPQPVVHGAFNYEQAALSPDGRWIAYVSDESGRDEIYLRAFPPAEERWIVSAGGGSQPSWRRDGREIFFVAPESMLMGVQTSARGSMELGIPQPFFHLPLGGVYQVAPDGRFLVAVPMMDEEQSPIHVVMNWANELKTR